MIWSNWLTNTIFKQGVKMSQRHLLIVFKELTMFQPRPANRHCSGYKIEHDLEIGSMAALLNLSQGQSL